MPSDRLSRSFRWLNITQFLGALNDNVFQMLLILFLIGVGGPASAGRVAAIAAMVFVAPFLVFTAWAGTLADRFSKRDIVVSTKAAELAVMLLGIVAFIHGRPWAVYSVLFLMCTQSAFFGPSKYGIVPELVRPDQLSRANGLLEALTYLAIVIGAAVGPSLSWMTQRNYALAAGVCAALSAMGLTAALRIERTPTAGSRQRASLFFPVDVMRTLLAVRGRRGLLWAMGGTAMFLLLAAFLKMALLPYGMDPAVLGWEREASGLLFVLAALGIGIGSYLAGRWSGRSVEFGMVPLGLLGLGVCNVVLGLVSGRPILIGAMLVLVGASAGLFIVPLQAFIQWRAPEAIRGRVVAAANWLGWVAIALAAVLFYLAHEVLGLSAQRLCLIAGLLTMLVAVASTVRLLDVFVRFLILLGIRVVYRIRASGLEHVPIEGGALLVSNHVSWVDSFLIGATQQRPVRFMMDRDIFGQSRFQWLLRLMGVILISEKDGPKSLVRAFREARRAMDAGHLVCIFAEGAITRTGTLQRFKSGFERIMRGSRCPIIPVYIGGAWGSLFSWYSGRLMRTWPRRVPYPISIHFGKPLPAETKAFDVRQAVLELSCDYYDSLRCTRRSLGERFVRAARRHWRRQCVGDTTGKRLSYGQTLTAATALAHRIAPMTRDHETVGILLPPSVGGAIANLALSLLGKTAVNLNYTGSVQARRHAKEQCGIRYVLSSRAFLEKARLPDDDPDMVFLEDVIAELRPADKLRAYFAARWMPVRWLCDGRFDPDRPATVIFSSGSTGRAKGVVLTHHNILSNVDAAREVFHVGVEDDLCGILPFFHSFGYTVDLWLVVTSGASVSYIPNPLDARAVGQSVRDNHSTILMAAPTFLLAYTRRVPPGDFASLRRVVTGAEKLCKHVADAFEERFGVRPLEGYGATELSPVVSLNLPDVEYGGVRQVGTKEGTIGQPIPGVAVRVVDLETGEPLGPGQAGVLQVKGPNVMAGYLNKPDRTAVVLRDGWYSTGDVASIDEDGFITITDRLARFSKIGGEMVPHLALEEVCASTVHASEPAVAVTSLAHPTRGGELVVLYVPRHADPEAMFRAVAASDLPNLYKPRRDHYLPVEAIPVLGSGKLDLMALKRLAVEARTAPQSPAE